MPRVLPKGLGCWIDVEGFEFLPVFKWLMGLGNVAPEEMARTFNCGIGMAVVVGKGEVEEVTRLLEAAEGGAKVYRIGEVQEGEACVMRNLERWTEAAHGKA